MQTRPFGKTGFHTTPIAFGAMRAEANSAGISPILLEALEKGVNFIDTARNYGESEAIVGRTLKEWRGSKPYIATKVKPLDVGNWRFYVPMEEQFTPQSIVESVETSLRTLGVDCIDLIQLHQWYFLWTERPEWLETLKTLQSQGKVRHIGVSAQDHEHDALLGLISSNMVDSVQIVLNAFESRPFVSVIPHSQQRGIAVIARCLFDHSGALAGGMTEETLAKNDVKLSNSSREIRTEYLNRIARLKTDAHDEGMTLATLGIRFALSRPGLSNVAISLANTQQLDEAIGAASQGPLPEELFQRICREHVWIKNFYYFSKATVDGNKPS